MLCYILPDLIIIFNFILKFPYQEVVCFRTSEPLLVCVPRCKLEPLYVLIKQDPSGTPWTVKPYLMSRY